MNEESVFGFEKAEDSPGFLLWQVTSLWQRELKKVLEPFDLTHPQFVLLASVQWLTQVQKDVTQVNLAEHAKMDKMTASVGLRTLEARKLLQRQEHHTDTRAKTVELTESGVAMVKATVAAVELFDKHFFSSLGRETEDFNQKLRRLLMASEGTKMPS